MDGGYYDVLWDGINGQRTLLALGRSLLLEAKGVECQKAESVEELGRTSR